MKIVKYGAPWCGPCKVTEQTLKDSGYPFEDINVDENEDIISEKHIRNIPVVDFYKDNEEEACYRHVGVLTSSQLKEIIEKYNL